MPVHLVSVDPRRALQDAVRLAALEATDLRSAMRADALEPLVRVVARALHVPAAQVNVLTADRQVPVAACAPSDPDVARWRVDVGLESSYCQHVVASGTPLVVEDARVHPLVRTSLATIEGGVVAYLGAPVCAPPSLGAPLAGAVLGTVCAIDFVTRRWSDDDVALLCDLAEAITAELEVRAQAARRAAIDVAAVAKDALGEAGEALAESEARFRGLADSMPNLAWIADEGGAIVWYNERWFDFTGTTLEAMLGWGWRTVHHPDHVEGVTARFASAVAAVMPWEDTFPLRRHDGEWRWFLSRAVPVDDARTGRRRWFGTNTDITERILVEEERARLLAAEQEARRAAERANAARAQFLATMSHELRTPLNAIGGYAELLELELRGPLTEVQRADVGRIRAGQRHLLGLIDEILDYARLEGGEVAFEVGDVPVAPLLVEAAAALAPAIAARGLVLVVEPCDPALTCRADAPKLRRVLTQLLDNACKFTPTPGRVRLSAVPEGAAAVAIAVQDTGIGIPPDRLATVFEPFTQVDASLTRTAGGAGLGLAIARDFVRGMGGELAVDSAPGSGSTFTVRLPRDGAPALAATG